MSEGLIMNYSKTVNKTSINTNHNRKRLKVSDNPRYSQKHKNKMLRKKDRRLKSTLIVLSLAIIVSLSYFNINKRKALKAKRIEYNTLMNQVITKELKRDRLEAKLENSVDLNRIQRYAMEELGMVYAKNETPINNIEGN